MQRWKKNKVEQYLSKEGEVIAASAAKNTADSGQAAEGRREEEGERGELE